MLVNKIEPGETLPTMDTLAKAVELGLLEAEFGTSMPDSGLLSANVTPAPLVN